MTEDNDRNGREDGQEPSRVTDHRKIDPQTGRPRAADPGSGPADSGHEAPQSSDRSGESSPGEGQPAQPREGVSGGASAGGSPDEADGLGFEPSPEAQSDAELMTARAEAAENLQALQRERASFVNFRNRAHKDQEAARSRGVEDVLTALLPVLDGLRRAKEQGDLQGPVASIADKLAQTLQRFGVESFGEKGEPFDPQVHEAILHRTDASTVQPTVEVVVESGYRIGDKVVRAARVGVVSPEADDADQGDGSGPKGGGSAR